MKCKGNHYYGLISVPQIYATNASTSKILSTVYPTMSTLFYIVKSYCKHNRHVHAIMNHD